MASYIFYEQSIPCPSSLYFSLQRNYLGKNALMRMSIYLQACEETHKHLSFFLDAINNYQQSCYTLPTIYLTMHTFTKLYSNYKKEYQRFIIQLIVKHEDITECMWHFENSLQKVWVARKYFQYHDSNFQRLMIIFINNYL